MERSKLKEFIDEIIQEIEHDLDEATTSGAAGAYSTPNAFSDGGSKDKKLKKKIATQLGMKLVGKVDEELKEATFRPNSGTMSGGTYGLDNRKYELKRDVKGVRIGDYTNVTLPKGTIIYNIPGGVFAHHRSLKSYESGQNKYFNQSTFRGISVRQEKNTLISIEKNSKILESVNEEKYFSLKKGDKATQASKAETSFHFLPKWYRGASDIFAENVWSFRTISAYGLPAISSRTALSPSKSSSHWPAMSAGIRN